MSLTRRAFLQTSAAAATAAALEPALAAAATHGRKNVLFIGNDDQNTSLGCYGAPVHTPNLDALAGRGTRFASAYCQYPWCGPSRSSLMTGLAPDTTRVYDLNTPFRRNIPDVVTLAQLFRKNGYYSARVGKIYHQGVPNDIGTSGQDDPASWNYVFNPLGVDHSKEESEIEFATPHTRVMKNGGVHLGSAIGFHESEAPDNQMTDSLGADETIKQLQQHGDKPFFIAYGLYRPHVPWIVPKAYFDMYPIETIQARPASEGTNKVAPPMAYTSGVPNYGMSDLQQREAIRAYRASSTFMDTQVGRVLAELKRLKLEDSTIVVYWADHGWSLGEHGQWQKENLFQSATHVPLLFAGPGTGKAGQVVPRPVEHLDIYPTLAELCELKDVPTKVQGTSLVPLMQDTKADWDRGAVSQVTRGEKGEDKTYGYSFRTDRYRYTAWFGARQGEELYDYDKDPNELVNLAKDPASAAIKAGLRERLIKVTAERGRTVAFA